MKAFARIVGVVVAGVVVLATLVAAGFYGYVQLKEWRRTRTAQASSISVQTSNDASVLLKEAVRLYWLNNGPRAAPLFARAQELFAARGDTRDEIYAQVGRVRSEAETMSFVDVSRFLSEQLAKPIVQSDPRLRLWCLAAKGYTDIEIDYRASKRDWLEAQEIATRLGDDQWVTRASGELGLIAGLEANPGRAARLLGGALLSTMASGDTGGQIRFLELLGDGFEDVGRHAEALHFFERAIKLAAADSDSGLPFMGYEGKAQALVAVGRADEAKRVLEDALTKARLQQKRGHEAQLLILLGKLAAHNGDRQQAVFYFENAGQFAARVQFFRMEAGLYLPSVERQGMGAVVIVVDTSGSIGKSELEQFAGEISAISEEAQPEKILVVYCDAAVQSTQEFGPAEPVELQPKGGGGTDFRPAFGWVTENDVAPVCLIYLTDLCCDSYPEPPEYPVLWVTDSRRAAPFGDTIRITVQ